MTIKNIAVVFVCLYLFSTPGSRAEIIGVPWTMPDIKSAVSAAHPGDIILVGDGIYTGPNNWNIKVGAKNITIESWNGPEYTILQGECPEDSLQSCQGLIFDGYVDSTCIVDGFTFTGFCAPKFTGGAIWCGGGNPTIKNCIFKNNLARWGGAITTYGPTVITNCEFIQNQGYCGSALYYSGYQGPRITDCDFISNGPDTNGIGFGTVTVVCSLATFENCYFYDNLVTDYGIVAAYGPATFKSCLFEKNGPDTFDIETTPPLFFIAVNGLSLENCTIVSNRSKLFHYYGDVSASIVNSILAFNYGKLATFYNSGIPDINFTCTNIYGNFENWDCPEISSQADSNGNFSSNPFFCDAPNGDYHLMGASRCLPDHNICHELIGAFSEGCANTLTCGDTNCDGYINIRDIAYLINHMYFYLNEPFDSRLCDVDNSCNANYLYDAVYLIDYLYKGGQAPVCPESWPCQ